ncbi:hypothetical protein [Longimicrobium sp.]|jgi:hypothetical protein|uniref:hypothetical protein n=1 Tax=Longimicrobium sp. TaxID=2029185 RepID=UPI002ED91E71
MNRKEVLRSGTKEFSDTSYLRRKRERRNSLVRAKQSGDDWLLAETGRADRKMKGTLCFAEAGA